MDQRIKITTSDGEPAEIVVFDNSGNDPPQFFAAPPHAGFAPVLARMYLGANFHGSLDLHFYACTDSSAEPERLVLWVGETGDQDDDDIGRLTPIAWVDFSEQNEELFDSISCYDTGILAGLLTVALAWWIGAERLEPDSKLEAGHVLGQEALDLVWKNAVEISGIAGECH